MAFKSEFQNNQKLKDCAAKDGDHVGENFAPLGDHVLLIKKALNAWAKNNGLSELPNSNRFDSATGDRVALYKSRHKPQILNFKQQIDRIVGIKTVAALDEELPPLKSDPQPGPGPSPNPVVRPLDLIIYMTGVLDSEGFGGSTLKRGDTSEFNDVQDIPARLGHPLNTQGFGGSLDNNLGVDKARELIKISTFPGSDQRIILYGYSAGAKQLLEVCRQLEAANTPSPIFPNPFGLFFKIDLLVTIDAAARFGDVNRSVGGCVRRNLNFFQTSPSNRGSHGGPNSGGVGAQGFKPVIDNRLIDGELKETSRSLRHQQINTICHPRALTEINRFLHAPDRDL